jgi:hypothetical protein
MNTATNRSGLISLLRVGLIVMVLFGVSGLLAQAGSSADRGTLPGTPAVGTINYLVWFSASTPPTQVLTEDGYNSSTGPNLGYRLISFTPSWIFNASNFSPAPSNGAAMNMLFGGLGTQAGNIWTYSFTWDNTVASTNHLQVGIPGTGTCPAMTAGSRSGAGKVINWISTGADKYAIYRSQNPSGTTPANGYSNGRYDLVATVPGGTTTYLDTTCVTGVDCWHIVVPLNSSSQISSCHSVESNPNVVGLRSFRSADSAVNWPLIIGLGALVAMAIVGLVAYRRRALTH